MPIYAPPCDCTAYHPVHPPVHTYRHLGRWPPPAPRPVLHCPPHQCVQMYDTSSVRTRHVDRGERPRQEVRNERRVRFADRPVVIGLPDYPLRDASVAPPLSRNPQQSRSPSRHPTTAREPQASTANVTSAPPQARTSSRTRPPPPAPPPDVRPATATRTDRISSTPARAHDYGPSTSSSLHDLLSSFPSGLWDMRRNARPTYHPHHELHYSDPVFPHDPQKRLIKLYFLPCGRTEFSWITEVKADCRNRLTVNYVLDTISTELFRRSACRDLYEGHPCYSKVRSAHRIRTLRGYTRKPHYDDAFRNVDLYHVDRGQALYFKGLRPERLRDGEVVYMVKFSYA